MKFNYPDFSQAYPNLYQKKLLRRLPKQLRYSVFYYCHRQKAQKLLRVINNSSRISKLLQNYYEIAQTLFEGYVFNQYSLNNRIDILIKDLELAESKFPEQFFEDGVIVLSNLHNDLSIRLQLNPLNCMEGLWLLGLYHNDTRVYIFTFSIGVDDTLMIGSIQGAGADKEKSLIKTTTKSMHGLRPQQLMIWLAMMTAKMLDLEKVEAIGNNSHPRMNIRKRLKKKTIFAADYDGIWQDYDGELLPNGNWRLPPIIQKPIEEYASKKRSMYRKRYAMLDKINEDMQAQFNSN